ncbi:MAG: hypothetical protein AAF497_08850, partial [Planctomycetota bacterium]
ELSRRKYEHPLVPPKKGSAELRAELATVQNRLLNYIETILAKDFVIIDPKEIDPFADDNLLEILKKKLGISESPNQSSKNDNPFDDLEAANQSQSNTTKDNPFADALPLDDPSPGDDPFGSTTPGDDPFKDPTADDDVPADDPFGGTAPEDDPFNAPTADDNPFGGQSSPANDEPSDDPFGL